MPAQNIEVHRLDKVFFNDDHLLLRREVRVGWEDSGFPRFLRQVSRLHWKPSGRPKMQKV